MTAEEKRPSSHTPQEPAMRHDFSRLRAAAAARRIARRERRALESYLAAESLSPAARHELEIIMLRQGASH